MPEVIPSSGNRTIGSSAVAANGNASDIHHVTMRIATADIFCVLSLGNTGNHSTTKNITGPRKKPNVDGENLSTGSCLDSDIQLNLHC